MVFPNLELLNYWFYEEIAGLKNDAKKRRYQEPDEVFVFTQVWPNTGGGFSRPGYCYGDAMTRQCTTVFINYREDCGMVCFDNKPAYIVDHLTDRFMEDVRQCKMRRAFEASVYDEDTKKKD